MDFLLSFIGISILVVVVLLLLTSCVKIVPQAQALVVERLGAYLDTWSVGVHFKMPFIDRISLFCPCLADICAKLLSFYILWNRFVYQIGRAHV